jgi:hypothetical protein
VGWPLPSSVVGAILRWADDRAADMHELRVQRIEVLALRALGVRVDRRRLAMTTQWRRAVPPRGVFAAGPTRRELRAASRFVALVRAAARRAA